MSLIDTYKQKLEAQIHDHKAQLDSLKAQARRVALRSKFVVEEDLAAADKQLQHVKARFKELKGAGGSALGEISTGVKKALADLKLSTKKAARHFDTHDAPKAKAAPPKPRTRTKSAKSAKEPAK
jgi:hypothetical protein